MATTKEAAMKADFAVTVLMAAERAAKAWADENALSMELSGSGNLWSIFRVYLKGWEGQLAGPRYFEVSVKERL